MRHLVLKTPHLKATLEGDALVIEEGALVRAYGLRYFDRLSVHKSIALSLEDLFALSKTVQVYLIDGHGNRLGHFERYKL
jgi:hypothetical protein